LGSTLFVGHARPPANTVTGQMYKVLSVVVEVDDHTGEIVAADVTVASPLARDFLVRLLVGRNVMGELGAVIKDIERTYQSPSQRAIVQALHDVGQKYMSEFLRRASIGEAAR
jgi:hypothetical protein